MKNTKKPSHPRLEKGRRVPPKVPSCDCPPEPCGTAGVSTAKESVVDAVKGEAARRNLPLPLLREHPSLKAHRISIAKKLYPQYPLVALAKALGYKNPAPLINGVADLMCTEIEAELQGVPSAHRSPPDDPDIDD